MSNPNLILCIDDNKDIQELIEIGLSMSSDLEFRACSSGADAFEIIEDWHPDLILLDIVMPHMSGIEILKKMKGMSALETVPVVIITARAAEWQIEDYISLGAQSVIKKPFDPLKLSDELREILFRSNKNAL